MLNELSSIATDLLGLHGYALTPMRWADVFGRRAGETAQDAAADHAEPACPTAAIGARERRRLHHVA